MYPGSKTSFRNLKDGSSNTVIVCETKEPKYSAWFSAQTAGVVGFLGTPEFGLPPDSETDAYNVITSGETAINKTGAGLIPGWEYGPSSDHPGVVLHLFGDGSVRSFNNSIAPEAYGSLITRDGGEPVSLDE
jgi:hypothetical protein